VDSGRRPDGRPVAERPPRPAGAGARTSPVADRRLRRKTGEFPRSEPVRRNDLPGATPALRQPPGTRDAGRGTGPVRAGKPSGQHRLGSRRSASVRCLPHAALRGVRPRTMGWRGPPPRRIRAPRLRTGARGEALLTSGSRDRDRIRSVHLRSGSDGREPSSRPPRSAGASRPAARPPQTFATSTGDEPIPLQSAASSAEPRRPLFPPGTWPSPPRSSRGIARPARRSLIR